MEKIYPRTGDTQTVYLNAVVKDPSIEVGDYTIYNDFVSDPLLFERNNVLYHYPRPVAFRAKQCALPLPYQPRAADNRQVLLHCLWCEIPVQLCQPYLEIPIHLHFSAFL